MAEVHFDLLSILILLGISHGVFLSLVFFFYPKGNRRANRIMAMMILSFCISIIYGILMDTNLYLRIPHLLRVGYPFQLLFGPLLLAYTREQTRSKQNFQWKELIHYLPFLLVVGLLIPYYMESGQEKIYLVTHPDEINTLLPLWFINVLIQIQLWTYLTLIFFKLRRHEQHLKEYFSNTEGKNLKWIKDIFIQLAAVFILIVIVLVLKAVMAESYHGYFSFIDSRIIPLLVSMVLYVAGYRALTQPEIFLPEEEKSPRKSSSSMEERVLEYIEQEKPYLQPELTLPELAEQLNLTRNQLSAMINQGTGQNFFDFINGYRIDKVKADLLNPEKDRFTILALALDGGFNSKATFNKAFKEQTGMTPSQFKKTQRNS